MDRSCCCASSRSISQRSDLSKITALFAAEALLVFYCSDALGVDLGQHASPETLGLELDARCPNRELI
jgi:hypothetical protein